MGPNTGSVQLSATDKVGKPMNDTFTVTRDKGTWHLVVFTGQPTAPRQDAGLDRHTNSSLKGDHTWIGPHCAVRADALTRLRDMHLAVQALLDVVREDPGHVGGLVPHALVRAASTAVPRAQLHTGGVRTAYRLVTGQRGGDPVAAGARLGRAGPGLGVALRCRGDHDAGELPPAAAGKNACPPR